MTSYEEILESAKRLSSAERLQLADALLAEELGFSMWSDREDVANAAVYVSNLREAGMHTADGREKAPDEYLREIEDFNEWSSLVEPHEGTRGHRCLHSLVSRRT
jgi:hypothetical protein